MKSLVPNRHRAEILRKEIDLSSLGASNLEISVQSDRIVAQLWFSGLPSPFGEEKVISIVDLLRAQIDSLTTKYSEFSQLGYAVSDPSKLWVFFLDNYGMGSIGVCNCKDNEIEWNVPNKYC